MKSFDIFSVNLLSVITFSNFNTLHTQVYITKCDLTLTPCSSCVDFMALELQFLGLKLCSISACVYYSGESGWSPSELIREKV